MDIHDHAGRVHDELLDLIGETMPKEGESDQIRLGRRRSYLRTIARHIQKTKDMVNELSVLRDELEQTGKACEDYVNLFGSV